MQSDVSRIKERINIVDVVGEYVRLAKAGTNFKACCPFHEEKTPSFVVTEDRQTYHCFGCSKGGDVLSFVMEMENMEFREALQLLADRAGVELTAYSPEQKQAQDKKKSLFDAMDLAVQFYEKQLWEGTAGKAARTYLLDRGMTEEALKTFRIGFAPDGWHYVEQFLIGRGFSAQDLAQAGLLIMKEDGGFYDRFRARIMFPIADALGRVIGFSARVLPGDDEAQAKYINTPESPLYHKSDVLYGIDHAKQEIKKADKVIVVEGNMDVIAAHQAGIKNVVAVSGTAMTAKHITILKRYTTNFVLFFDADDAGQKAARKSAEACFGHDVRLSLVSLTEGKDAADLVQEDAAKLHAVVDAAENALTFFMQKARTAYDLTDPHEKRLAVEDVLSLAVHVEHPIERGEWIKKCVEYFDITEDNAEDIMQKFIADKQPPQKRSNSSGAPPPEDVAPIEQTKSTKLSRSLILIALSFPEAWKALHEKQKEFPFIAEKPSLQKLMQEGLGCEFDINLFLEKYGGKKDFYTEVITFRENYHDAYADAKSPEEEIIIQARRTQRSYDDEQRAHYTQEMKKAEQRGDKEQAAMYIQKVVDLSQKNNM